MSLIGNKQKQSVINKKKPAAKLKNILAQPFPRYWPQISSDELDEFKQLISTIIFDKNNIVLGLNAVLRAIRSNNLSCVLLSIDIKPRFIAIQIINLILAKYRSCLILCAPNMNNLTKELFNVTSLAIGIKCKQYPQIEDWFKQKQLDYPIPEKILQYYQCNTETDNSVQNIDNSKKDKKVFATAPPTVDFQTLYLPKSDAEQRSFIPANAKYIKSTKKNTTGFDSSDFISFSSNNSRMEVDEDEDMEYEMNLLNRIKKITSQTKDEPKTEVLEYTENIESNGNSNVENIKKKRKKKNKFEGTIPFAPASVRSGFVSYVPLKVNRIQPNPDKKRKKKKKK